MDEWSCAMGWSSRVAGSHARRLEREGWLERYRMKRGQGSLLVATRRGVRMSGINVSEASAPAPTRWAHNCACAWTAAWLSVRGRDWRGPREVLANPDLKGKLEWRTSTGLRRSGHRPDLTVLIPAGLVAVEVELQRKEGKRLRAVLALYGRWLAEERITGVIYVCGDQSRAERVGNAARETGLPDDALRIERLSSVQAQALEGVS
jgi:hypothetical protein